MTAPAPPPVDLELAEAEEAARDCVEIQCTLTAGPLTRIMAEYDRRGELMTSSASALAAVLESAAVVPNAELSRLRRIEAALRALVEMEFPTDGVIHRSSFEYVRREAIWDLARAALAAEVETTDVD